MNPYRTIFCDENIVVVSKKEGILVIKGRGTLKDTESLYDILLKDFGKLYIVHRIDKDTSGIVVFAKNKEVHKKINLLFEERRIKKSYLALVWGNIKEEIEINKPIKEFSSGRCGISLDGKESHTLIIPKMTLGRYSLVEAIPYTGRRHQIRVHLYSIGHPIVGDLLYGDLKDQRGFKRMYLHASGISFELYDRKYSFDDSKVFLDDVFETFK